MKRKKIIIILLALFLVTTLSACGRSAAMTASSWPGLTADEDTAYVAFNTQVVAVDLNNGTERWRFPAEADPKITFYAPPALTEDGSLIVGGYDHVLYKIDRANGQGTPLYEQAQDRYIGGPLVTGEQIYAPSADHFLYALNLNGQSLWKFKTEKPLWGKPATDADCQCIYLASMDHRVYAVDSTTGNQVWVSEDLGGAIVGTPVVSDDMLLYVGTFAKEMIALETDTGSVHWRFTTQDWVWGGPNLDADTLYFGDLSGTFYALDRQTGVSKWQIQPEAGSAIVGTPLVTEEGIYFTNESGSLVAVNSQGAIRWNQPMGTNLHEGPVQSGETLLIATSDPETLLIAVNSDGVQKWSFSLER